MKLKFLLFTVMSLSATSAFALANAHDVICSPFSQQPMGQPLIKVSVDSLSGRVSMGETTYHLQCQPPANPNALDALSCTGVQTPHQVKVDIWSVDGVLNMGTLTVDGIEIGSDSSKDEYLPCAYSFE